MPQKSLLPQVFLKATSPLALVAMMAGCASHRDLIDPTSCNQWTETRIGTPTTSVTDPNTGTSAYVNLPISAEFKFNSRGSPNQACQKGYGLGVAPLIGRQSDGILHPVSIVAWHQAYQKILDDMASAKANANQDLEFFYSEIKRFADYFTNKLSGGTVTIPKLLKMIEDGNPDPAAYDAEGKKVTNAINVGPDNCGGAAMIWLCNNKPATEYR